MHGFNFRCNNCVWICVSEKWKKWWKACSKILQSFILFLTFLVLIKIQVDIAIPEVFVGGLLGSMLIYLFSAWACAAVGRTAQEVVKEVRRQFIERPGIMVGLFFWLLFYGVLWPLSFVLYMN